MAGGTMRKELELLQDINIRPDNVSGGWLAALYKVFEAIEERLDALDGQGNGDIDAPDVFAGVANTLTALQKELQVAIDEPKPPDVCEGCAREDDCGGNHNLVDCIASWIGKKPSCYVEEKTCGTCAKLWRKSGHVRFPCFDNPVCKPNAREHPVWRGEKDIACPNHKKLEV